MKLSKSTLEHFKTNSFGFQKGFAVMTTIIVILGVVAVMLTGFSIITINVAKSSTNIVKSAQSYYASEAAIEDVLLRVMASATYDSPASGVTSEFLNNSLKTGESEINFSKSGDLITVTSKGDASKRNRNIKVVLDTSVPVFTYAVQTGIGGLEMSINTMIHCVGSGKCEDAEGQTIGAGTVYVNGNILANGKDGSGYYNKADGYDAIIVGNVFAAKNGSEGGRVDIRPSERWENEQGLFQDKVFCLGNFEAGQEPSVAEGCDQWGRSVVQAIKVKEGGKDFRRAAFKIAAHGDAGSLPENTNFYFVRESGGDKKWKRKVKLDQIGSFNEFKIDTNYDGLGEVLGQDAPYWVYFNFDSGTGQSVGDNEYAWFVLQVDSGSTNTGYWKLYYNEFSGCDYTKGQCGHTGGWAGHLKNDRVCTGGSSTPCDAGISNALDQADGTLDGLTPPDSKADFHFRAYNLGAEQDNYTNSLQVEGELHADEAIGATVKAEGEDDEIAFVGRRFVGTYWEETAGVINLYGKSILQQMDACDISSASGYDDSNYLGYSRGFPFFCESNLRNVPRNYSMADRKNSINNYCHYCENNDYCSYPASAPICDTLLSAEDMLEFYENPYSPSPQSAFYNTPVNWCEQADKPQNDKWCCKAMPGGDNATYYIKQTGYGGAQYPYYFCDTDNAAPDYALDDEESLKNRLLADIKDFDEKSESDINDYYMPKAPAQRDLPLTESRISAWANLIAKDAQESGCVFNNDLIVDIDRDLSDECGDGKIHVKGDLFVKNGAMLTIGNDMYVEGDIRILSDGAETKIRIEKNSFEGFEAAIVIADGVIDTERKGRFDGWLGSDKYILAISRSKNKGDNDPYNGESPAYNENPSAIFISDSNKEAVFYARDGTIVLDKYGSSVHTLQLTGWKVIMRRNSTVKYRTGILDFTFPEGPASAISITKYEEI